ncbi:MAG: hypothetical protein M3081_14025 [Gemmatimonadota bacterium]|nr:hypothetical protein [Gemmatimonadota bacterium]
MSARRRLLRLAETWMPRALVRPFYMRHVRLDAAELDGTTFKLASTPEERMGAFRLVHDNYVRKGLIDHSSSGLKVTPFNVLPTTAVFVAIRGGIVVGTLSLIEDGPIGLPMDEVFPQETRRVRERGGTLAELSGYAIHPSVRGRGVSLMLYNLMFRWVWWHRRTQDILIAVHPRVTRFYEVVLMFDRLRARRSYRHFNNAPAEALHLDLRGLWQRFSRVYKDKAWGRNAAESAALVDLYDFFGYAEFPSMELPVTPGPGRRTMPPAWSSAEIYEFVRSHPAHFEQLGAHVAATLCDLHPILMSLLQPAPRRVASTSAQQRRVLATPSTVRALPAS